MGKTCAHGLCNSNTLYVNKPHMEGVTLIPFPKPISNLAKCLRWVEACNRLDFTVSSVSRSSYICSKHFIGGNGPSDNHPDPVIATASEYPPGNNRTKKRLKTDYPIITPDEVNISPVTPEDPKRSDDMTTSDNHTNYLTPHTENYQVLNVLSFTSPLAQAGYLVPVPPNIVQNVNTNFGLFVASPKCATTSEKNRAVNTRVGRFKPIAQGLPSSSILPERTSDKVTQGTSITTRVKCNNNHSNKCTPETLYNQILSFPVPTGWAFYKDGKDLIFIKLETEVVVMSLKLDLELKLHLKVRGEELNQSHKLNGLVSAETVRCVDDIFKVLVTLDSWKVCRGSSRQSLINLYLRSDAMKDCRLISQTMSLHSNVCHQMLPLHRRHGQCEKCGLLVRRLCSTLKRRTKRSARQSFNSRCNVRYLPMKEIQRLMVRKNLLIRSSAEKIERLKKRFLQRGVDLEDEMEREDEMEEDGREDEVEEDEVGEDEVHKGDGTDKDQLEEDYEDELTEEDGIDQEDAMNQKDRTNLINESEENKKQTYEMNEVDELNQAGDNEIFEYYIEAVSDYSNSSDNM